jgi:hypothetical protein
MQGYNVTILTYGQTGSGKTFAMEGSKAEPGIINHSLKHIYANKQSNSRINCSSLQLYNEKVTDLLNPNGKDLKLRWEHEK